MNTSIMTSARRTDDQHPNQADEALRRAREDNARRAAQQGGGR